MRARRGVPALLTSALALVALTMPTVAAGATRWVDDDGKAGPAGCAGRAVAPKVIQAAVNAAKAGDTVIVCPGDYEEDVVIGAAKDGLTLRAARQWTARILQPAAATGEDSALIRIARGADRVTVRGLVLVARPGVLRPDTSGGRDCYLGAGIWVLGRNATILANRVRVSGYSYQPCGLVTGVRVGQMVFNDGPAGSSPASAVVSHNAVRDTIGQGISASGSGVSATIARNSVRYWHLNAGRMPAAAPAGPGPEGVGITIRDSASGVISGNEVSSGPEAYLDPRTADRGPRTAGVGPGQTPALVAGILVESSGAVEIRGNTVQRTSGVGDTVLVCPGTYREQVSIGTGKDRLTLRSTGHWTATILTPTERTRDATVWIRPGADGVRVEHRRVRYRAVAAPIPTGLPDCGLDAGILVEGANARIRSNNVSAFGAGTLSCGMEIGILVASDTGTASASVRYTIVQDTQESGILAAGPDVTMTAFRNIVRHHHTQATSPRQTTTSRVARRVAASIERVAATVPSGFGGESDGLGIGVVAGAEGEVLENTIEASRPGRGALSDRPRSLAVGILADTSGDVSVERNRVFRAHYNVLIDSNLLTAGDGPAISVQDNTVTAGRYGIIATGQGARIEGNQARGNSYGLYAAGDTSGNLFADNDARWNYSVDCADMTAETVEEVQNTWSGNLAFSGTPKGLCVPPEPS